MEFETLVRSRRMRRSFNDVPVDRRVIEQCVDLARLSPSAGKSQGWNLVVLEGSQTEKFWSCTLPVERRSTFAWPGLLRAPVIAIALADPTAYVERYSEADKAHTGLMVGEVLDSRCFVRGDDFALRPRRCRFGCSLLCNFQRRATAT